MNVSDPLGSETIRDFGNQWKAFTDNEGYYGSVELLQDFLEPLVSVDDIAGKHILDIGSGTGRIVNMLIASGASHVTAVEPSNCFDVLKKNTLHHASRISYLKLRGDEVPSSLQADMVVSIGVIHHIPDPYPTIQAIYQALLPAGLFVVWLYGREGNEAYLSFAQKIRKITTRLPHHLLSLFSWLFVPPLLVYIQICQKIRLPLNGYARKVLARMSILQLHLTIYDQLNPMYSKYYTKVEAETMLCKAGFVNVRSYHRHGYSWTVVGIKPDKK